MSGPGTVTFSAPTAATTTAFSAAGTHVLRLTGSDSVMSGTADVTVTVSAANQAPAPPSIPPPGDHDKGHGNDPDGNDEANPGKGKK